jgi:glutathionylspermidine synthase
MSIYGHLNRDTMSCFKYNNNRKQCFDIFGKVVEYIDEKYCNSENEFKECIFYKMMTEPEDKHCKFMEVCSHVASITLSQVPYEEMKLQCETYCLNEENRTNCAIYKLFEELEKVPIGLLPDGKMINVKDRVNEIE